MLRVAAFRFLGPNVMHAQGADHVVAGRGEMKGLWRQAALAGHLDIDVKRMLVCHRCSDPLL
jgi:hypothetical protein